MGGYACGTCKYIGVRVYDTSTYYQRFNIAHKGTGTNILSIYDVSYGAANTESNTSRRIIAVRARSN